MHLVLLHKNVINDSPALFDSSRLLTNIVLDGLRSNGCLSDKSNTIIALPQNKPAVSLWDYSNIIYYDKELILPVETIKKSKANEWFVISNGRFITDFDCRLLRRILANCQDDIIAVNVSPVLLSYREEVRIGSGNIVGGFRRYYRDSVLPDEISTDWPCHIFIKTKVFDRFLANRVSAINFSEFVEQFSSKSVKCPCFKVGGNVFDLKTESGSLNLLTKKLGSSRYRSNYTINYKSATNAKIFGKVIAGNNVQIADDAVIVGPTILDDNVKIERSAVIRASAISAGLTVPESSFIQNRILAKSTAKPNYVNNNQIKNKGVSLSSNSFRTWPILSYPRCIKRIADIIAAVVVLVLFAPVIPVIAMAIKLNSPGPVFFKHKRQGQYGKGFSCLKFRTMISGADKFQEKLRFKNQVDGPQFKVEDDPRVTAVGRFMRDTFIDEIPQFINILLGQMSLVGPRPSPEAENSLSPGWHDARLSVRPGITGLWQVRRTRQANQDFQEWIHYDNEYVKNLSLKPDLLICLQTIRKLTISFAKKF